MTYSVMIMYRVILKAIQDLSYRTIIGGGNCSCCRPPFDKPIRDIR